MILMTAKLSSVTLGDETDWICASVSFDSHVAQKQQQILAALRSASLVARLLHLMAVLALQFVNHHVQLGDRSFANSDKFEWVKFHHCVGSARESISRSGKQSS